MANMRLRKLAIVAHRWLGVFFCLLFTLWFASGIVMMYWTYPGVSGADRLEHSPALNAAQIRISPEEAWMRTGSGDTPARASVEVLADRPAYRFDRRIIVFADTGERLKEVSPDLARKIAAQWTGEAAAQARFLGSIETEDQWTVSGEFRRLRPLLKYSWPSGEEVYVSTVTAQVEQYTTRGSRLAAWCGAIPHWLYFTALRKNGPLWNRVVIWSSGIATFAGILGLIVGAWIAVPARRIPYSGMKRWHTVLGLGFGVIACTWAFSGMLSMDPFPIEEGDDAAAAIAGALRGGRPDLAVFSARDALARVDAPVKQIELAMFAGEPVYIAHANPPEVRIVPLNGDPAPGFDAARILEVAARAAAPARIAESRLVSEYESYYIDRHGELPLPAVFLRLDDPQKTMFYIDAKSARIVASYGNLSRWNRWLYHGLHSMDFPWLYNYRPLWDIVVISFMIGGTALCVTSLVLAWRVLGRKLKRVEAISDVLTAEVAR